MTKSYEIIDPRPIAAAAPYTYFLPLAEELKAIGVGDHVKATLRPVPPSQQYDAERMWIRITSCYEDWLDGVLASTPLDMPSLPQGSTLRLPRSSAIAVIFNDPVLAQKLAALPRPRAYWARCLVDQSVLDGDMTVEYLYRETPDLTKEGDEFPDSGWRIRGDTRGELARQIGSRKIAYVALGAVLNKDDSWLHLVDERVGSRFELNYHTGTFVKLE